MKIQELIDKLKKIKRKSGNVDVDFDTEGAEYNCHLVPIDYVEYQNEDISGRARVCLHTNQEESRQHCTDHRLLELIDKKKIKKYGFNYICTVCGKPFIKGTIKGLKKLGLLIN